MATLPSGPRDSQYPPTGYRYRPDAALRPPAPRRPSAGKPEQRRSKPQALELVRNLKRAIGMGAVLTFGCLSRSSPVG
jgi:hypothetical protein